MGIRAKLRPLERAAFYKGDSEKSFKKIVRPGSAAPGNAATRMEAFVITGGIRSYGGYPDIDGLFREQAVELDLKKREALLHRIQQLMHERVMFVPIVEPAFHQRRRAARGRVGLRLDHGPLVLVSVRGDSAEVSPLDLGNRGAEPARPWLAGAPAWLACRRKSLRARLARPHPPGARVPAVESLATRSPGPPLVTATTARHDGAPASHGLRRRVVAAIPSCSRRQSVIER